jgi:nucleoside-diphosphate kinase
MLARTAQTIRPQLTLALLKPDLYADQQRVRKVHQAIKDASLQILYQRDLIWHPTQAEAFYAEHRGRFFYERLCGYMSSGPFQALVLGGDDAIQRWRSLIGPTHPVRARIQAPQSLRSLYGISDTRNSFHGSDAPETAKREINFFFPELDVDACLASFIAQYQTQTTS